MTTIQDLEERLDSFEKTLLQMSRNLVPVTSKADDAYNIAEAATPYTESKNVYIGNTECAFDKVKDGNISAWLTVGNEQIPCTYEVANNAIIVKFEALEAVGTANISIQ